MVETVVSEEYHRQVTDKLYYIMLYLVSVVFSYKTDRHDITELLLKVVFNAIALTHVITVFKTLPSLMNVVNAFFLWQKG
jgi:hypothetical protein